MSRYRKLTPNEETAYHLETIALGSRIGNHWALGEARRMLASKVLLEALEVVAIFLDDDHLDRGKYAIDDVRAVVRKAVVEASGAPDPQTLAVRPHD